MLSWNIFYIALFLFWEQDRAARGTCRFLSVFRQNFMDFGKFDDIRGWMLKLDILYMAAYRFR